MVDYATLATSRHPPAKMWPLVMAWIALVFWMELVVPSRAISRCKWPGTMPQSTRIALVADPQLVDPHTYPGRGAILEWITEMVSDRYLAKNWRYIQSNIDPDATVFLGDLFDGGRQWENKQWLAEYQRFNTIFPQPTNKRTIMNLPGNHDIGFGDTIVPMALDRFKAWFGPTSEAFSINDHNIVILDTISMSNTINKDIYEPPNLFIDELSSLVQPGPVYLCTHVPLYRPKNAGCGRFRESERDLPYAAGVQYLTQISPQLSQKILETVQPVAIFSGDDHDACHVIHNYTVNGVEKFAHEFTVKSMSMAMGIASPGIQLLTLNPTGFETSICLQAHPLTPFILYGFAAAATIVYLLYINRRFLRSALPTVEVKDKWVPRQRFPWSKVSFEAGSCLIAFLFAFWYSGRLIYEDL